MDSDPGAGGGGAPSATADNTGALSDMIGQDLAAASSPDTSQLEPPPVDPVQPLEGAGTPAQPEQPPAQQPAQTEEQQPEPAAEPEDPDVGNLKPEGVDVSDSRWQRMVAHNKYARELAKALEIVDPEDTSPLDVTSLPSAEEVRSAFDSRGALEAMEADFLSPDPQDTRNLISQWNQISPDGMQRLAAELPRTLMQMSPPAYQALATPVIQRFIDYMYEAAAQEARPELQRAIIHGAQLAEWWATGGPNNGTYRSAEDIARASEQRAQDPLATERQRLAAERAALDQHYQQIAQTQTNEWRGGTNAAIDSAIDARAEQDLAALKATAPDAHYQAIKNEYIRQIHARVQQNRNGMRGFDLRYEQALRGGFRQDPSVRDTLVNDYMRMAAPAANAIRAKFVSDQSKAMVAQNQARHAQLQASAQKVGPASNGQPVKRDMAPAMTGPQPGETHSDYMLRLMKQDWQNRQAA